MVPWECQDKQTTPRRAGINVLLKYDRIILLFIALSDYQYSKQNRESTEGYSRLKVEKRHGKFWKTGLNNWSINKSPKGRRNQVSGRVSVTSVANDQWKPLVIR